MGRSSSENLSQKLKNQIPSYLRYGFFVFILLLLISPIIYRKPGIGLDQSWQMALNMAIERGFVFGTDFIFTYGPLGFLCTRSPLEISKFTYILLDIYLLFNFGIALNYILGKFKGLLPFIVVFPVVAILNLFDPDNTIIFLSWIFLFMIFHFQQHQKILYLANALILSLVIFFTKLNLGLIITGQLYLFFIYGWYSGKFSLKEIGVFTSIHVLSLSTLCFVLNVDFWNYLVSSLEIIKGYLDAMYFPLPEIHTEYPRNLILIGLMAVFPLIWMIIHMNNLKKEEHFLFSGLFVLIILYVLYKQSITRSVGTLMFQFAPFFMSLLLIFRRQAMVKIVLPMLLFTLLISYIGLGAKEVFSINKYQTKYQHLVSYVKNAVDPNFQVGYDHLKSKREIPERILKKIGGKSVDIIPWEISYLKVNDLNYNPRPVIQSYTAYTSYLDHKNFQKYMSNSSPDFVLFTNGSIDGRFTFFDETQTKLALLANYEVVDNSWKNLLLEKLEEPIFNEIVKTEQGTGKLNQFIKVKSTPELQYFKADIDYSLLGEIRKLIYQAPELKVTFKFESGKTATWRAVKPIIEGGVIINKYNDNHYAHERFITYNGEPSRRKISEVKFQTPTPWAFNSEFDFTNQFIRFEKRFRKNKNFYKLIEFASPLFGFNNLIKNGFL